MAGPSDEAMKDDAMNGSYNIEGRAKDGCVVVA